MSDTKLKPIPGEPIPGKPRFTKRHYEVLADEFRETFAEIMRNKDELERASIIEGFWQAVGSLCTSLTLDNPRFDADRFRADIAGMES